MGKRVRISVNDYTESFYNFFASTGINRNWLFRRKDGQFQNSYIGNWRLLIFLLLRLNVYVKIVYLLLLFNGYVHTDLDLDFFTKYGIVIWLVTTAVSIYSDFYYLMRHPCFEILCAFWNIQSEIFILLSMEKRENFKKRLDSGARFRTTFHMTLSSISIVGLGVQYYMDPKGVIFSGSIIDNEPWPVSILLCFHEEFFLWATWTQAVSVILLQVLVYRELAVTFDVLTDEVSDLSAVDMENDYEYSIDSSRYSIDLIFAEYRKLQLISEQMKRLTSSILLSTIIIYFAQISSDVFVMIQLLRLGAGADVGWYVADCSCSMLYWFVSLNSLSELDTSFTKFHETLRIAFYSREFFKTRRDKNMTRKSYLKMYRSFRHIATWIGPCPMTRETVGNVMMTLVNYYILAAMW